MQCDGSDEADVLHRMAIAHTTFRFGALIVKHRADHRLSRMPAFRGLITSHRTIGTRLQRQCSTCFVRSDSGDCERAYIGHIPRMPDSRVVRRALMALTACWDRHPLPRGQPSRGLPDNSIREY